MNFTSRKLLAAALLAAIPMGSALACTTDNWTDVANGGGTVTNAPGLTAGGPVEEVARYSGECGLEAVANSFVTNNAPDGEGVYRARFYVYTSGSGTVFRASAADDNGGAEVLRVDYSAGTFSFFQNGAASGTVTGAGVVANKWYSVEIAYEAGEADGFSATVAGNSTFSGSVAPQAAGAGTVGSHSLGNIGGTGTVSADAFESTRSADTAIGRLLVSDADGSGACDADDLSVASQEIADILLGEVNPALASGQPDCDENGSIDADDLSCSAQIITTDLLDGTLCGV